MKCSMLKYKWMYIAVFCCAMFAACEPATIDTPSDDKNAINFGGGRTHATTMTNANAKLWGYTTGTNGTNGYWVFAGTTTGSLTEGENAQYVEDANGDYLLPAITRYWADNQTYNFYSIWPIVGQTTVQNVRFNKSNSQLSFSYGSIEQQVDLCVAAAIGEDGGADRSTDVNFTYKHALAKVQFRGFSSTSIAAKLTELKITVPSSATAVCTLETTTLADEKDANGNITTAHPLTIAYTLGTGTQELAETGTTYPLPANPDKSTSIEGTNVAEWLVFPQTSGLDEITISATYILGDGSDATKTKTVSTTLPIDKTTSWQAGKRYIYDFYIQPSGPITFGTVTVKNWEEGGSANIDFSKM